MRNNLALGLGIGALGRGGSSTPPPADLTLTALDHKTSGTDTTTYTFTSCALGPTAADKYIIVAVEFRKTGAAVDPTSVTVDGIAASALGTALSNTTGGNQTYVRFWKADLTADANATGNIVVTLPATALRCGIQWGYTSGGNPIESGAEADDTTLVGAIFSGTIDVPAHGFALAALADPTTASGSAIWSLSTENGDNVIENALVVSSALQNFPAGSAGLAITATMTGDTGSGAGVFKAAAFVAA